MIPILLIMLAVPAILLAAIAVNRRHSRKIAILSTAITLFLTLYLLYVYLSGSILPIESYSYINALNISMGLQATPAGIIFLIISSVVLFAASLTIGLDSKHGREAAALILLFQIASTGLFLSTNLFLLFVFWDIGVIAMFFMIYLLGSINRRNAAMKFLVYEIFASAMLFLGIILIYSFLGTVNIQEMLVAAQTLPQFQQLAIFIPLLLAFLINMPVFPFHLWLPEAHTEASTEGSMILSGVLTKFGGFGMLLLFEFLPITKMFAPEIAALAVISAFYSVLVMMRQKDLKKIVAYSTIVDMAIVLLALSTFTGIGQEAAVMAMLAHALVVALMFLIVGIMHKTFGERDIRLLKGTIAGSPLLSYAFIICAFSMVGLPLTVTFVAELLVFISSYSAFGILGLLALAALAMMGAFLYFVIQKVVFDVKEASTPIDSADPLPFAAAIILLSFIFAFGIMPYLVTAIM
jgi:NADH-quinone oxidoreductase subunit M